MHYTKIKPQYKRQDDQQETEEIRQVYTHTHTQKSLIYVPELKMKPENGDQ
jgi:hypothetical protein